MSDSVGREFSARKRPRPEDVVKAQKKDPPSAKEKEAIEFLRNDSQARTFFINKIAAPVLNKMFDCGMIP